MHGKVVSHGPAFKSALLGPPLGVATATGRFDSVAFTIVNFPLSETEHDWLCYLTFILLAVLYWVFIDTVLVVTVEDNRTLDIYLLCMVYPAPLQTRAKVSFLL